MQISFTTYRVIQPLPDVRQQLTANHRGIFVDKYGHVLMSRLPERARVRQLRYRNIRKNG